MNSNIRFVVSFVLLSTITLGSASMLTPRPAQAAVIPGLSALVVGGSIAGLADAMLVTGAVYVDKKPTLSRALLTTGLITVIAGVLILDGSGSASFGDLTPAQADKIGLSKDELAAYENELDELNVVFQDNQAERAAEYKATGNASLENSKAEWKAVQQSGDISPLAFSAAEKIAAKVVAH